MSTNIFIGGEGDPGDDVELFETFQYYLNECQCANPGGGIEIIDGKKTTVNIYVNWTKTIGGLGLFWRGWVFKTKTVRGNLLGTLDYNKKHKCHKPQIPTAKGEDYGKEITEEELYKHNAFCPMILEFDPRFPDMDIDGAKCTLDSYSVSSDGFVKVEYVKKGAVDGTSCGNTSEVNISLANPPVTIPSQQNIATAPYETAEKKGKVGPKTPIPVCKMKRFGKEFGQYRPIGRSSVVINAPLYVEKKCFTFVGCPPAVEAAGGCEKIRGTDAKRATSKPGTIQDAVDQGWDFGPGLYAAAKAAVAGVISSYVGEINAGISNALTDAGEHGCGVISVDADFSLSIG